MSKEKIRTLRLLITGARILSCIFIPSFYPLVGFIILLSATYMSLLPWDFKLMVLSAVYIFTIAMPWLGHKMVQRIYGWTHHEMHLQHNRAIAYIIKIICYLCCLSFCKNMNLPYFMGAIIVVSLLVNCLCVIINTWNHISAHSAGTGAIIGCIFAYSTIFHFNPTWWLCASILLSGAVMSSRMLLRGHTLKQVLEGTAVGICCGLIGIILF